MATASAKSGLSELLVLAGFAFALSFLNLRSRWIYECLKLVALICEIRWHSHPNLDRAGRN